MLGAKPISTPIDYNQKLQNAQDEEILQNPTDYRQIIGKLLYLTFSKLDISCVVQAPSQHMDKPSQTHFLVAHRAMKYLKNAHGQKILMISNTNIQIFAYSDNDWA